MSKTLSEIIINCLVDIIFFLEFSDENIVDPDSAMEVLETISCELKSMNIENRKLFYDQLNKIALASSEEKRSFIKALPQYLGFEQP